MSKFEVGSVIAVRNTLTTGSWPALIVDPVAGKKWADRDTYFGSIPGPEQMDDYVLVRVLGLRLAELPGTRSALPKNEPNKLEIVRWVFAQRKNLYSIAGPDVESIKNFYHICRQGMDVGMKDKSGFLLDVSSIIQYLYLSRLKTQGKVDPVKEGSFLAMLEEVLPQ
jgi:hypothetical protein